MNFLAPTAFFFAAAIPVVIVFYLLKRKRVVRLVPSTLLWQKFLAETQASAPFQKLRHNWLLVLQILLLLLAIFALARPYLSGKTASGRILVIILDGSASMQAKDESPTRFEKARAAATELVNSMHDNDSTVVLLAAGSTEVKQSPTSEKSALRRAIQSSVPTDSPTRLNEALKLAETLIQNNIKAEIHLYSDGAAGNLVEFENKNLPIIFHRVGQGNNNLGIVNIDVRANPENPAQRAVFTTVGNYASAPRQTQLELRFGDQVLEVKSLEIPSKQTVPVVFITPQAEDGIYTVRLSTEDDLAADNQASIVSLLPQTVKVLLVSAGNKFLEKAIRAAGNVELRLASTLNATPENMDIVVLDNVMPAVWPTGNILSFRATAPHWFQDVLNLDTPAIVDWRNNHPLLRFVTFDTVQVAESAGVNPPPWAVSLVDSPQRSMIVAGELGKQRIVWVGFDSLQSTWPLRVSFPIFVANAIGWLNPATAISEQLAVRAGDPFRMSLLESVDAVEITTPDGKTHRRALDPIKREVLFGETGKQGIYAVKAGTNQMYFCANLIDAAESDITPKPELVFGKYAKVSATTVRQANLELWRWIALAALCVLSFEWWFYHKRSA